MKRHSIHFKIIRCLAYSLCGFMAGSVLAETNQFSVTNHNVGQSNIDFSRGGLSYQLQLPELPMTNNIGPDLRLMYQHQGRMFQDGFGAGWSLPLSAITYDSAEGLPKPGTSMVGFLKGNKFLWDGVELVVDSSQGGNQLVMIPREGQEDIRLQWFDSPKTIRSAHGSYELQQGFELKRPDGIRYYYSAEADSAESTTISFRGMNLPLVHKMALRYVAYPNGQVVEYEYQKRDNVLYLKAVVFAAGNSRYDFSLTERTIESVDYGSSFARRKGYLYTKIAASYNNKTRDQWCLVYQAPERMNPSTSMILTHEDCRAEASATWASQGSDESFTSQEQMIGVLRWGQSEQLSETTLRHPDLTFTYSRKNMSDLTGSDLVKELSSLTQGGLGNPNNFRFQDLNMDGLVDIARQVADKSQLFLGTGDPASPVATSSEELVAVRKVAGQVDVNVYPNLSSSRWQMADIDGDSYIDLVELLSDSVSQAYIYFGNREGQFISEGGAFSVPAEMNSEAFVNDQMQFWDINGDGRDDLIKLVAGAEQLEWLIIQNRSEISGDWGSPERSVKFSSPARRPLPLALGNNDLAVESLSSRKNLIMDVNFDGLPDLIRLQKNEKGICIFPNIGRYFYNEAVFGGLSGDEVCAGRGHFVKLETSREVTGLQGLWFVDLDSDGMPELLSNMRNFSQIDVLQGLGAFKFAENAQVIELGTAVNTGSSGARSRLVDIDADGITEILVATSDQKLMSIDFNRLDAGSGLPAGLLLEAKDSLGAKEKFLYGRSIDESLRNYSAKLNKRDRYEYFSHIPDIIIKQVMNKLPDLLGDERFTVQDISYHFPIFDPVDRMSLGFSSVEVLTLGTRDSEAGLKDSRLEVQSYYSPSSKKPLNTKLSGIPKTTMTIGLQNCQVNCKAMITASSDQANEAWNGLDKVFPSAYVAEQKIGLAQAGIKIHSRQDDDYAVEARDNGTYYLRLKMQRSRMFADGSNQHTKTETSYGAFDEFNLPSRVERQVTSSTDPLSNKLQDLTEVVEYNYSAARSQLAALGIVDQPNSMKVTLNGVLVSSSTMSYDPATGSLKQQSQESYSGLISSKKRKNSLIFGYDSFGNVTSQADSLGLISSAKYSSDGSLLLENLRYLDKDGSEALVSSFGYDENGRLKRTTSPLAYTAQVQYDDLGRPVRTTGSDGSVQEISYIFGKTSRPSMIKTKRITSSDGSLPAQEVLAFIGIKGNQDVTLLNDEQGGVLASGAVRYGDHGRLEQVWSGKLMTSFMDIGAVEQASDEAIESLLRAPKGPSERQFYDAMGRIKQKVDPRGLVRNFSYEDWGVVEQKTCKLIENCQAIASDNYLSYLYRFIGAFGIEGIVESPADLSEVEEGYHLSRFERDEIGFLKAIILPGGDHHRTLNYDTSGRLEKQVIPGVGTYVYDYDTRGRRTKEYQRGEKKTVIKKDITYDFMNRPTTISIDDKLAKQWIYDSYSNATLMDGEVRPLGLLTEQISIDSNGLHDFRQKLYYDAKGQLTRRQTSIGASPFTEGFGYNLNSQLVSYLDPFSSIFSYSMGSSGRILDVTHTKPLAEKAESFVSNLYGTTGMVEQMTLGTKINRSLSYEADTYDLEKSSVAVEQTNLEDILYSWDGRGSLASLDDMLAGTNNSNSRTASYSYNWKNELSSAKMSHDTFQYRYRGDGRFIQNDEFLKNAVLDPRLIPDGAYDYSFDEFGRLAKSPKLEEVRYDGMHRMTYTRTQDHEIYYGYDSGNIRTYKEVRDRLDPSKRVLHLYPSANTWQTSSAGSDGVEQWSYLMMGGQRLGIHNATAGETFYYINDHLGSSRLLLNEQGQVVKRYNFTPYGQIIE